MGETLTCSKCIWGDPDSDMGAYICRLDYGLRYGWSECDCELCKVWLKEMNGLKQKTKSKKLEEN